MLTRRLTKPHRSARNVAHVCPRIKTLKIAILAGEASGDILGARLIDALRRTYPEATFYGIAGPLMQQAGCESLYPMERLSVMGLFESFGRYPELIPERNRLAERFLDERPAIVIGVDAPDFNLTLELKARRGGLRTAHYVSPSVWAWRRYRIKKIARAVDLMLTLFPFEAAFFRANNVPVEFVGHPLADEIEMEVSCSDARRALGLPDDGELVALLPGSRMGEVTSLADTMLDTAEWVAKRRPGVRFVVPLINESTRAYFEEALSRRDPALPLTVVSGESRTCMAAANFVVLASGTATLEAMLLKKPMVIAYRATALTYFIMRHWLGRNIRFAGLPNLLADQLLVPELMQEHATAEWLGPPVLAGLSNPEAFEQTRRRFDTVHAQLRKNASERAAQALIPIIER